jgi:hypothetical protein
VCPIGSFSALTLDGDNGTWSITLFGVTGDAALKALREPDCFTRVVQACPLYAHRLEGAPITGVLSMAGIVDRYHRFKIDGQPRCVRLRCRRRCGGLYQSVGGPGDCGRAGARPTVAQCRPRSLRRSC